MKAHYFDHGARFPSVAPDPTRQLLTSDSWNSDPGVLAIQIVKTQLKTHETRTKRHAEERTDAKNQFGVPSLFNIAAQKLANAIGENAEEDMKAMEAMEGLPPNVLSQIALKMESMPYDMFCKMRQSVGPGDDEGDTDEWVLCNEVWLREASTNNNSENHPSIFKHFRGDNWPDVGPRQSDWQHGIVRLSAHDGIVFAGSQLTETCRSITRPTDLPGFKILDGKRPSTIRIQPSVEKFARKFEFMTGNLLNGLNWDHVFVAGGIVLGALLCTEDKETTNNPEQWKDSDVDLYIYGLGPVEANKKIEHIFEVFKKNLPEDSPVLVVRNSKTITFFSKYPLRRIQVVLKLVDSPKAVLLNFDLDICAVGWDGEEVWMLPRAARALQTGYTVFTMELINGHYLGDRRATQEERVFKYADKGYGIRILPSYLRELQIIRSAPEKQKALGITDGAKDWRKDWSTRDFDELVTDARKWTVNAIRGISELIRLMPGQPASTTIPTISHAWLQERYQVSEDPQRRGVLSNLSLFLRHVALWEHEIAGDISITKNSWAAPVYDAIYPDKFGVGYNDIPDYSWDDNFKTDDFATSIMAFNEAEDRALFQTFWDLFEETNVHRYRFQVSQESILEKYLLNNMRTRRMTHATSVQNILQPTCDIHLPVWLPQKFLDFAGDLIIDAVQNSGVPSYSTKALIPGLKDDLPDSIIDAEGLRLVFWRITNITMWQQLNRTIDEIHEVLWSFHHVNAAMSLAKDTRLSNLVNQFARRAIRMTAQDEYGAFARWVARLPAAITNYNNEFFRYLDQHSDEEEE